MTVRKKEWITHHLEIIGMHDIESGLVGATEDLGKIAGPEFSISFLKYAFDNGFNNYKQLMGAVENNLKSIYNSKRIVPSKADSKIYEVTIAYGSRPKTYYAISTA